MQVISISRLRIHYGQTTVIFPPPRCAHRGGINIAAGNVLLENNSNIRTNVAIGTGGGGQITLTADSILAFNDSNILAFAQDGAGGNINLNTPIFFGNGFHRAIKIKIQKT
ncbi:MAG: hypothetical protein N5P05_003205 [Chroococcopsis gigantea SAG 12.99]|nr:hypothetical protein [Chroococcopsis gigantea SAG 12.99]